MIHVNKISIKFGVFTARLNELGGNFKEKANLHALQRLIYEDCYYTLLPFLRVRG